MTSATIRQTNPDASAANNADAKLTRLATLPNGRQDAK